jgi:hypothetical protein
MAESHHAVRRGILFFPRLVKHGIGAHRHSDVEAVADFHTEEPRRSYAENRERPAVEPYSAAGDGRVSAELALPESMTDYGSRRSAAWLIILRAECSPNLRRNAQHVEEIAADEQALRESHLAALG